MKLYTRTTKKTGAARLYIKPRIGNAPVWLNLGLNVPLSEWHKTFSQDSENNLVQSEAKIKNLMRKLGYEKQLQDIEAGIRSLRRSDNLSVETASDLIETIILADLREAQEKQQERTDREEDARRKDVRRYIDNFISSLKDDDAARTKKGEVYARKSINGMKHFHGVFMKFYRKNKVAVWDDIDKRYIQKFISYVEKDYMRSSVANFLRLFRLIMGRAFEDGARTLPIHAGMFYCPQLRDEEKRAEIYLTNEELDALFAMELGGSLERARDLFLIGCFTGQRFSDYNNIDSSCIGETAKGTLVLRLSQRKTHKRVVIPILDSRLISLLEKYGYNPPRMDDSNFARNLKKIGRKLAETVPSLAVDVVTNITKKERDAEEAGRMVLRRDGQGRMIKYRWELITSHTARRTCITLMHLSGKYTIPQMMAVSGHTRVENFFRYLKQSLDDDADSVAKSAGEDGLF